MKRPFRYGALWRALAAAALVLSGLAVAGCEPAPGEAVCQVGMSPEGIGTVVHDGRISGIAVVSCDAPITSVHVSVRLIRITGGGYRSMGERDYDTREPDGRYEAIAPCIPGKWRFSYSVVVTANGETKTATATGDVTMVGVHDC